MKRIQYKIKNAKGKYFNGFGQSPKFGRIGEPHVTLDDCKATIAKLLESASTKKRKDEYIESLYIVKEELEIEETKVSDISVSEIHARNELKAKAFRTLINTYGFLPGHFMSIDLERIFPVWDLGEYVHGIYIHSDFSFVHTHDTITDVIKHIGAKRKEFKRGDRFILFKDKNYATMTKLHVNGKVEYIDLSAFV